MRQYLDKTLFDLQTLCNDLQNMDKAQADKMKIRRSLTDNNVLEIDCFLSSMRNTAGFNSVASSPFDKTDWDNIYNLRRNDIYTDGDLSVAQQAGYDQYFPVSGVISSQRLLIFHIQL